MKRENAVYWIVLITLAAWTFLFSEAASICAENTTKLHNIRYGEHRKFERLVFDIEGAAPSRIGHPSASSISIEFNRLQGHISIDRRAAPGSSKFISRILPAEEPDDSKIVITLKRPNVSTRVFYLPYDPPRPGWQRLVVDFSSAPFGSGGPGVEATTDERSKKPRKASESGPSPELKLEIQVDTAPLQPQPAEPSALNEGSGENASSGSEEIDTLYRIADATFLNSGDNLLKEAPQIVLQYLRAMKAGPTAPQAPTALYRSGLSYMILGDVKKAKECFEKVVSDHPRHPLVPLSWLGLGQAAEKRQSYVEAVQAFQNALSFPLEKSEMLAAHHGLGRSFAGIEAHEKAVESLGECVKQDPRFYRRNPEALKLLGQSLFVLGQYDDSRACLLRYLNLNPEDPDRTTVLARIAEILWNQDKNDLAHKVCMYIAEKYPDSEGHFISAIREAEYLEQQDGEFKKEAIAIYSHLSRKSLPPPLSRLVSFKLASWERQNRRYEQCLNLINDVLRTRPDSVAFDEFAALKERAVLEWANQAYTAKDYVLVLQLYQENRDTFDSQESSKPLVQIADAFAQLKGYSNASELYEIIWNKSSKTDQESLLKAAQHALLMNDVERAGQLCLQIRSESLKADKNELLGRIYFAQARYKDAAQCFDRFFEQKKGTESVDIDSLLQYAESLLKVKRHAEALSHLQKAADRIRVDDFERRVRLGLLESKSYEGMSRTQEAIEALESVLPLVRSEHLRDQLNYKLSTFYIEAKDFEKANEKLVQLSKSTRSFWKTVAEQQLITIEMQNGGLE